MNKPNGNNQIMLLFEPDSNMIINVINKYSGETYLPEKIELVKSNIYDWAKSIKPAPGEFGELSSLLMALKRHTPDDELNYKFSNNGNFLTEYLLGTQKSKDININKHFWVSYTKFGKYHALNVILTIKFIAKSAVVADNNFEEQLRSSSRKVGETFEHIRHELINPLHAIKISGDQIRNHIRQTNGQISPDDIDKYNNIILSQVDNSIDIINTFTQLHTQPHDEKLSTPELSLEKIPITVFRKHIESQIEKINQTYFMLVPVHIEWDTTTEHQSEYILTHYVCISMNYMKIILDNIFRNIYGHLSAEHLQETKKYNNKFIIALSASKIELKIYNEILCSVNDKPQHNTQYNWHYLSNKSAQHVINKYDLLVPTTLKPTVAGRDYKHTNVGSNLSEILGQQCSKVYPEGLAYKKMTTVCELSANPHKLKTLKSYSHEFKSIGYKPNKGVGLKLINNLCQKMNVQWQLIDNQKDICFTLSIPVLTDTRQLPIFYELMVQRPIQELVLC